jgi:NAD(P)-dependent dehydrogenase (short-subunit alcohol dehydrogenase family)
MNGEPMPKTQLATGTSSGIGRASVRLFQQRGWNVIATMRTPQHETELRQLPNVLVTRADVTDEVGIRDAMREGIARFGQVDVLLNNAGYGAYGPLEATPIEHIRKEFETNVIGALAAIKAIVPHFRERRAGTIVNISSMGGRVAMPLGSLYHGSKFAVEGMTEALQYELAEIGVAVKLVEPGMTRTNFGERSFQFNDDPRLTEYRHIVARTMHAFTVAGKDAANAEAVAETIYRVATDSDDRLRHVTGEDAEALLQVRVKQDDAALTRHIRQAFGLDRRTDT